jgi:hypothetical protein
MGLLEYHPMPSLCDVAMGGGDILKQSSHHGASERDNKNTIIRYIMQGRHDMVL